MEPLHLINVFISSVYGELKEYRQAAIDAVWRCDLYPDGMEREDVAKPFDTGESSRHMVDRANVYVGIFSQRYGLVTVKELRRAQARGIPVLIFIADTPLNRDDVEPDRERAHQVEALKAEMRATYVVASFRTRAELRDRVFRSLLQLREEGIVRAPGQPLSPHTPEGSTIPVLPDPFYAHPYVLSQSGFVGREAELAVLDAWARGPDPLLLMDAIGGAGKSALAWYWMRARMPRVRSVDQGVIWWSFYESDATMGTFLARALAYVSQQPLDSCVHLERHEQEEQLLTLLQRRRVVMVLDGIERLLTAYHRHDAARVDDAEVETGPRACIDRRDGSLLRALTLCQPAKVLLTSRLVPQDLQDRAGDLVAGVRRLELRGLSPEDAIELLESAGVHGSHGSMRTFLAQFGDHALLVRVLAGRIRVYRPAPGNFDQWYAAIGQHMQLDETDLTARQNSVLAVALEDLAPDVFRLLCQIAAFRYPVDYAALIAVSPFAPPPRPEPTVEQVREGFERLHAALSQLEERGLLQWDREHNRYDLHPVVRAFSYGHLEDKPAAFGRIRDYFTRLPAEKTEQADDVSDLRRTLEIYHALVGAGLFDDAVQLYLGRLARSLSRLEALPTIVEMLSPLFTNGLDKVPALRDVFEQASICNELASALTTMHEFDRAFALRATHIHLRLRRRELNFVSGGLAGLGAIMHYSGRYASAERAYLLGRDVAEASGDRESTLGRHLDVAYHYGDIGDWRRGELAYAAYRARRGRAPSESERDLFEMQIAILLQVGKGRGARRMMRAFLAAARAHGSLFGEREACLLLGEEESNRGNLAGAEDAWQAALAVARRQGVPLGRYLSNLAIVRAKQGLADQARQLLGEALASDSEELFNVVEAYILLGDREHASQYIVPAYTKAWADGPPHANLIVLRRARKLLAKLGMSEPRLPAFDPTRVPLLPDEEGIRALIAERRERQAAPVRKPAPWQVWRRAR